MDATRVSGMGICTSAGYMVDAAAGIPHLPSVGLVAPWLQNQSILETVYGGPEGIAGLMQVAAEAEATGIQNTVKGIAIAANAQDRFSGIDVLVNNAGYGIVGAVEETPQAELRALMKPNFFGAVTVTQAALPLIRKRRNGAIVMISSLGGPLPFWRFGTSLTSKFARDGLTEALAQEIA
ncbi:MAG: SDR family NAD(P)-dependent oxidoreductase, partial [Roseobacter sp.]